jgi:hypothetical protein
MCSNSCSCGGFGKVVYLCSRCLGSDSECPECKGKGKVIRKCPKDTSYFEETPSPDRDTDDYLDFHRS